MNTLRRYWLPAATSTGAAAMIWAAAWTGAPPALAVAGPGDAGTVAAPPASVAAAAQPAPDFALAQPVPASATGPVATLAELQETAEQNNLQLKQAALQIPKARYSLDRAKSTAAGPALAVALQQRYGVALPADDAGAAALRRTAELGVQQAALSLAAARQNVRLAVTRAYVEWQKAAALAQAQEAALARARAQQESANAALSAGSAAKYDLIQADAQVASQKAALAAAGAARESARLALQRLVGASVDRAARPEATLPIDPVPASRAAAAPTGDEAPPEAGGPLPDAGAMTEKALAQRPEVALARLGAAQKKADLELLSRSLPAGDPVLGVARVGVDEAAIQVESALADVELQVRQALLAAGSARERLAALTEGESQAREAMRLAGLRFAAGTATTVEVTGAQAVLSAAEAARIQTAGDLSAALAALRQAAGEL